MQTFRPHEPWSTVQVGNCAVLFTLAYKLVKSSSRHLVLCVAKTNSCPIYKPRITAEIRAGIGVSTS